MSEWGWAISSVITIAVGLWLRLSLQDLLAKPRFDDPIESPFEPVLAPKTSGLNARPFDWRCADDRGQL